MPTQKFTQQDVDQLSTWFQRRYEAQFAWKSACSAYQALPVLRGFWPMSAVAYTNPQGVDQSGNGLHLINNNSADFGYTDLIPWVEFNGTTETLSYTDTGAGGAFDIIGNEVYVDGSYQGLTFYAWVYFTNAISATEYIMAKYGAAANLSYRLIRLNTGELRGTVTTDGATAVNVTSVGTLAQATWYFTALQFEPSTQLSVWINDTKATLAVGIPATIFDSTAAFVLGAQTTASNFMAGRQSLDALCASFHADTTILSVFHQTRAMFGI